MLVQDTMQQSGNSKVVIKQKLSKLLEINQIPAHLRFNKYVLTHYRPPTNFIGCLKSLFYLHNETVNILTHGKIHVSPNSKLLPSHSSYFMWRPLVIHYQSTLEPVKYLKLLPVFMVRPPQRLLNS